MKKERLLDYVIELFCICLYTHRCPMKGEKSLALGPSVQPKTKLSIKKKKERKKERKGTKDQRTNNKRLRKDQMEINIIIKKKKN